MANNKVAYGLAKEYGIDTTGMTPKEVWDALNEKGITQSNSGEKSKEVKDLQSKSTDELKEMATVDISKQTKSKTRKDKYGNPLLSDEAFMVGVMAVNNYLLEESNYLPIKSNKSADMNNSDIKKKEAHEYLKKSNIYVDALEEKISDALYDAGYNDDYDITEQDIEEIIGYATGENYKYANDRTPSGFRRWTGEKYSGYQPAKKN
jgi:hypothetical protein